MLVASPVDTSHSVLLALDGATGARIAGTPLAIPVPSGFAAPAWFRFGEAAAAQASIYAMFTSTSGATTVIRRIVVSLASTPTVIDETEIVNDAQASNGWTVRDTSAGELLLYETDTACLLFLQPHFGGTGTLHLIGRIADACGYHVAMDVRDPAASISGLNPLGIAWESLSVPLTFVQVTGTSGPVVGAPMVMTDSNGSYRDPFAPPHLVSVSALPGAPGAGHWLVANVDQATGVDPMTPHANVQLREIVGNAVIIRRLDVPGEMPASRSDIDLAFGTGGLRLAERANDMGIVTRSIGCE